MRLRRRVMWEARGNLPAVCPAVLRFAADLGGVSLRPSLSHKLERPLPVHRRSDEPRTERVAGQPPIADAAHPEPERVPAAYRTPPPKWGCLWMLRANVPGGAVFGPRP
jgi:hypothetical protein